MPPEQQPQRPGLHAAIGAAVTAQQTRQDTAQAPARDAFTARIKDDAALYGTPAWDALTAARRELVQQHSLNAARTAQEGQQ